MDGTLAKTEIAAVYTGKAPYYGLWATLTEGRARTRALELAAVRDGESVLEVAVGTGLLFTELLRRNPHGFTDGIDLTEAMLARARTAAERIGATNWRLRVGDAYALEVADASVDVLLNSYMFDLLPEGDFPLVLGEFRRVLRPGGRLVLVNLARGSGVAYRAWEWVFRRRPGLVGGCRGVAVADPVRQAGLSVTAIESVVQLGFASEVLLAVRP